MNKTLSFAFVAALLATLPAVMAQAGETPSAPAVLQKLPSGYVLDKVKGSVLVLGKGEKEPVPAVEEQVVQSGDEIITKADSEVSLSLNGGTMVQVSPNSRLKISEIGRKGKEGFKSRLMLAAGRILAQVEKLARTRSSFEIEAGGVVCGVRGTAFEVQVDGSMVQNNTYEGLVELRKDKLTEQVAADHHSEISGEKGAFRGRLLTEREKARYMNWQKMRELIARRQSAREEALRAFDSLPGNEQEELWKSLKQTSQRDRLRSLRQLLREREILKRNELKDHGAKERAAAIRAREDALRQRLKERQDNLRK